MKQAIDESILHAYFNAVFISSFNFNNSELKEFKKLYPKEYSLLNAFYRIRSKLKSDLELMKAVGTIQWFTLTFDNKHDRSLVETKRKNAMRFLNNIFIVYEMVEEYGEDSQRYHIHGFGVFKDGKGFEDFKSWPSRQKIEELPDWKIKKKIKYLTKYAVKDLPRVRRSKKLVYYVKLCDSKKGLKNAFNNCYRCNQTIALIKLNYYNVLREKTAKNVIA